VVESGSREYRFSVKPEAQWYFVEALSNARGLLGIRDDYEAKQNGLSHFAGVLAAFRYMRAITQDEEHAWYRKMLVALGYELPDPVVPRISSVVLTRTSLYLVATTTIWEIEANSVGNRSVNSHVAPGWKGFVGSPPPPPHAGCRAPISRSRRTVLIGSSSPLSRRCGPSVSARTEGGHESLSMGVDGSDALE
jgi:hypothetical protein